LLSPTGYTESGYRLYTEDDLLALQNILSLKFLGFSLEEIKALRETGPTEWMEMLSQQKALMEAKRKRIDAVIRAIGEAETLLQREPCRWDALIQVIQAIQMDQDKDWTKNYFTDEQRQKMDELSKSSYSESARRKLADRQGEWTEEDQKKAEQQWKYLAEESDRLAAAGADPGGPEAQALAQLKTDLLSAFTRNDPEIEEGLNRFWQRFNALPAEEKPFDASPFESGSEGTQLLNRAMEIYRERL
jgi:DNA-binding transcriptional MerR regulator